MRYKHNYEGRIWCDLACFVIEKKKRMSHHVHFIENKKKTFLT